VNRDSGTRRRSGTRAELAGARAARRRQRLERGLLAGAGLVLFAFMAAPLVGLFGTASWSEFVAGLKHPLVWPALRLSLITSSASLACVVLFGTPLAWVLVAGSAVFGHPDPAAAYQRIASAARAE